MSDKTNDDIKWGRREELRGLFVCAVVAGLLAFKESYSGLTIKLPLLSVKAEIFSVIIIVYWGLYIFFMVLGASGDVLPKDMCDLFRKGAIACLISGFVFFIYFGLTIYILGYLSEWKKFLTIYSPLLLFVLVSIYDRLKKFKPKVDFNLSVESIFNFVIIVSAYGWMISAVFTTLHIISPISIDYIDPTLLNNLHFLCLGLGIAWFISYSYATRKGILTV